MFGCWTSKRCKCECLKTRGGVKVSDIGIFEDYNEDIYVMAPLCG